MRDTKITATNCQMCDIIYLYISINICLNTYKYIYRFNLLQPYGHTALGQVLCEAIFMTELIQYRVLYVFALKMKMEIGKFKYINISFN